MLVQINGMQADVMDLLLDYLYTSRASITADNVQLLLEASNLFQVRRILNFVWVRVDADLTACGMGMKNITIIEQAQLNM